MANAVYLLCALTSGACALLLFRLFWQHRRRATRLALWSSLSFAWFAVSNAFGVRGPGVFGTGELAVARAATACVGGGLLLVGLIWETE